MKTNFEKMYVCLSRPYKQRIEKANREYQKFLKSFISDTLTGRRGFQRAFEEGTEYYRHYLLWDGGIPKELYPKHEVMEHFIEAQIADFERLLVEDPISNRNL
jgi:hypothetical protein